MKKIFKAIFAIAAGITLLASCQQAGDVLALALSGDQTVIEFDGAAPQEVTVNLSADGDWYAYAPEWITISPSHGTGNAAVKMIASKNLDEWNELNAPRADVVAFCGAGDKRFSVNVSQMGEAGLEDRRGKRLKDQTPRTREEELEIEVAKLKHELYMTKMERDVLKKLDEIERREAYRK